MTLRAPAEDKKGPFLDVRLTAATLDRWQPRNAILTAVTDEAPTMSGLVLDVGCGQQPYRPVITAVPAVTGYVGVDMPSDRYAGHDVAWDGLRLPVAEAVAGQVLLTEVLEHCPDPSVVLAEVFRVLRPGGRLLLTVPFLWPLHDAPYDEWRYTPFSLDRLLRDAGFTHVTLRAMGGWDASMAQLIGLWVRRRPMGARKRALLSALARPVVKRLVSRDRRPDAFTNGVMLTGISGTAAKP
jgi:SAM-dependent methyltransferase